MGRSSLLAAVMVALAIGAAAAQVGTGPLAEPNEVSSGAKPAATTGAKVARKTGRGRARRHASKANSPAAQQPLGDAAGERRSAPISSADHRVGGDTNGPISFGMKWNGANDSAEKTRVQNYDGNAEGTGAEVGLKLHF